MAYTCTVRAVVQVRLYVIYFTYHIAYIYYMQLVQTSCTQYHLYLMCRDCMRR